MRLLLIASPRLAAMQSHVTRLAQSPQILPVEPQRIAEARERSHVMDMHGRLHLALTLAVFAQRMLGEVRTPQSEPLIVVASLLSCATLSVLLPSRANNWAARRASLIAHDAPASRSLADSRNRAHRQCTSHSSGIMLPSAIVNSTRTK